MEELRNEEALIRLANLEVIFLQICKLWTIEFKDSDFLAIQEIQIDQIITPHHEGVKYWACAQNQGFESSRLQEDFEQCKRACQYKLFQRVWLQMVDFIYQHKWFRGI